MAEMSYTQHIERWITESKKTLIRDTNQLFKEEYLLAENANFQRYTKECLCELKSLREKHCNGTLAYAMIKMLHSDEKLNAGEDSDGMCILAGKRVHASNIRCPSAIKEEDYETYAVILTSIAVEAARFNIPGEITEELLYHRFLGIFSKNRFLQNTKQEKYVSIEKKHIVELCFSLGWNSEKCDALLLRTDLEPLWANSMDDAVYRFILDVRAAKWKDKYDIPAAVARQAMNKKKPDIVLNPYTNVVANSLELIIKDKNISNYEQRQKYVQHLYQYQQVFDRLSNTSRNVLEHLLLYVVHNMGWQFEGELPKNILKCDIPPLSRADQERLIKALYTGQSPTTADLFLAKEEDLGFKATYKSDLYSYPQYVESEMYRISIHDQLLPLLNSEIRIGKNHILYALYLVFATSEKGKKKNARENPVQDYASFVEVANAILNYINLPQFYAPCPTEYMIAVSILAGAHKQEVFRDATVAFVQLEGKKEKSESKQDNPEAKAAAEQAKNPEKNMPVDFTDGLKKDLEQSMKSISADTLEKLKEAVGSDLYDSLEMLAQKITKSWRSIGLLPLDVKFLSDSHSIMFCPDGYKPACLGVLDANLSDLLFGTDASDGKLLKVFWVPYEKEAITLYDVAATYPCNGEESLLDTFLQNPRLNLRYRQNCILRLLGSLVMRDFKVEERPEIHTKTGKNPYIKFPFINEEDSHIKAYLQDNKEETPTKEKTAENKSQTFANQNQKSDEKKKSAVDIAEEKVASPDKGIITEFCKTYIPPMNTEATSEEDLETQDIGKAMKNLAVSGYEAFEVFFAKEVQSYQMLSDSEEEELIYKIRQGDENARDKLIECNLRVVVSEAKKIYKKGAKDAGFDIQELADEGCIYLITATKNFDPNKISDPEKKARFSTYASRIVRYGILHMIMENRHVVQLPPILESQISALKKAEDQFYKEFGILPTIEELSEIMNKTEIELKKIYDAKRTAEVVSYDALISEEGETSFLDTIKDPLPDMEDLLIWNDIKNSLPELPPRVASIISLHYGLTDTQSTYTLKEISEKLNISLVETVRLELDGLNKIRRLKM